MPNILVLGDVHGEWAYLASLLLYLRPDICIVAGDFGWWPGWGDLPHEAMPREVLERTELHFADGNHENHRELLAAAPRGCFEAVEIAPRIISIILGALSGNCLTAGVFFSPVGQNPLTGVGGTRGQCVFVRNCFCGITCRRTCLVRTSLSRTRFRQH